ncbi:Acetyl esterase/lipase [Planctomicrobium piriforme]|uniref:Acetyl esterase/lipase n=2 Tax=Planctomicrobium piriforme TaxID=1576369 RepID=A0A1I3RD90_9PLAN|nr:Acetyl esterase/lipase [Planctomicrobium piriforme]
MTNRIRLKRSLLLLWICGISQLSCQAQPVPPAGVSVERGIVFGKGGDQDLKLDLALPKRSSGLMPAIICVHGGGWRAGNREALQPFLYYFSNTGIVCLTIDYRLAPQHQFPAPLEDVKCAVRWLRANAEKYHVDPDRIALFGGSAGAHLAALAGVTNGESRFEGTGGHAAQKSDVCAVIGWAGPYDLTLAYQNSLQQGTDDGKVTRLAMEGLLGGPQQDKAELYRQASPVEYVKPTTPPMVLLHGEADTLVPIEQAELMEKKLKEAGVAVELLRLEGAQHSTLGKNPPQTLQKLTEHVNVLLRLPQRPGN